MCSDFLRSAGRSSAMSPLIGWPSKALPSAFQPSSVPVSKLRFSGLPSAPTGMTPGSPWGSLRGFDLPWAKTCVAARTMRDKHRGERARASSLGRGYGRDGPIVSSGGRMSIQRGVNHRSSCQTQRHTMLNGQARSLVKQQPRGELVFGQGAIISVTERSARIIDLLRHLIG